MPRKTITDTALATPPPARVENPTLAEIIKAGVIALDISDADADMLEGMVIDGQVYDLADTPELAKSLRHMFVEDGV